MWEGTKAVFVESLRRVVGGLAGQLPVYLAMLLVLLLTVVAALAVGAVARHLCGRTGFDRAANDWGLTAAAPGGSGLCPSRLVARLASWAVGAVGMGAALVLLGRSSTTALAARMLAYLPHVLVAIVFLAFGVVGSRVLERSVTAGSARAGLPAARLIGAVTRWLALLFSLAVAMEHLGVGGELVPLTFEILLAGLSTVLVLTVGLGARQRVARSLARRFPARERRRPAGFPRQDARVDARVKERQPAG
jgi:hypothetical protein